MKKVRKIKRNMLGNRAKVIAIRENTEDKQCITSVKKNFVYMASRVDSAPEEPVSSEVTIRKCIDNKAGDERFDLRVKGAMYVNRDRGLYRVEFSHSLKIHLHWKVNVFSPKNQSSTLA